jgi:hypothetical protein
MADIETIKERVQALLAKAADQSCTEAEAEGALMAARKLMAKFNLTEEQLHEAKAEAFKSVQLPGGKVVNGLDVASPLARYCGKIVGQFTSTKIYTMQTRTGSVVVCFGFAQDTQLAQWIMASLQKTFDEQWLAYKQFSMKSKRFADLKEARIAFTHGFTSSVVKRLQDWLYREEAEAPPASTALVVVKAKAVDDALSATGVVLGAGRGGRASADGAAYGAGAIAGNAAHLGQSLGKRNIAIGR